MHGAQESRPRAKSPFVAAFLSLLFPGLGHAYAGAYQRALGFAAPLILVAALGAGIALRANPSELITFVLTSWVLPGVFVLNLALLIYRLVAIIDAYRVTVWLNALAANSGGRLGRPRLVFNPISLAGLFAVILVMAGGHVVVAKYDLEAHDSQRPLRLHHGSVAGLVHQTPSASDVAVAGADRRRRPTRPAPASPSRRSRAPRCRTSRSRHGTARSA
jgi:hypothetical protein